MKYLFVNFHPVDPQVVKYVALELKKKQHEVLFVTVEKEGIIEDIIKSFGLEVKTIGKARKSVIGKIINIISLTFRLFIVVKKFNPILIFSPTSPIVGYVAKFAKIPYIAWGDTETAIVNLKHSLPYVDSLLLPDCFYSKIITNKVIYFKAYKEIAYLHPKIFKPKVEVLSKLGIEETDIIVLMRFSALHAMHDIGLKTKASNEYLILDFIRKLERDFHARIFISVTERDLSSKFNCYKLNIAPEDYIHLLAFCSLYIGEGTTTASEAGILGVPWIALRPQALGYLDDQEYNYDLGIRTDNLDYAFQVADKWLSNKNLLKEWKNKTAKLWLEKINLTEFLIWFLLNYPESHHIMQKDVNYQKRFL